MILTEFSKLSVIGNNKLDKGLSLKNIIDGYIKYEDFKNIIDNKEVVVHVGTMPYNKKGESNLVKL